MRAVVIIFALAGVVVPTTTMKSSLTAALKDLANIVENLIEGSPEVVLEGPECAAGTFYNATSKLCQNCSAGSYSKHDATFCIPCSPGTHSPKPGSAQCYPCDAGSYTNTTGRTNCTFCPPGYINQVSASVRCTVCSKGRYSYQHTHCKGCTSGAYLNHPDDKCSECPPNTVSDPGAVVCTACGPHQHPSPAKSECIEDRSCVPGERYTREGDCVACGPGTYSNTTNAPVCTACSVGYFNSKTNQTNCTTCPAGTYSAQRGCVHCTLCSPGHYNPQPKQARCLACYVGTYADKAGSVLCAPCKPGSFAPISGTVVCRRCKAGTSQADAGQLECVSCKKGTYQSQSGQDSCIECPNYKTYTTYGNGSVAVTDCIGPLLTYATKSISGGVTDTTAKFMITPGTSLEANSGTWLVKNPKNPEAEAITLLQGDRKTFETAVNVTLEPIITNMFCYKDPEGHGSYFSGYQQADSDGNKCATPCRNPDGRASGPYCPVPDTTGGYIDSTCGIPTCIWDVECAGGDGTGYRGNKNSVVHKGVTHACQYWNADYPHPHVMFHPTTYNRDHFGLTANNTCRNPDPRHIQTPWCYTTSVWLRTAPCGVQVCTEKEFEYFKH